MAQPTWTDGERTRAIQMVQQGIRPAEIGREIGKTKDAVYGFLKRRGLSLSHPGAQLPEQSVQFKISALRRRKKTLDEIAEATGETVHAVRLSLEHTGQIERDPLPVGHPVAWGVITAGTVLEGTRCPL